MTELEKFSVKFVGDITRIHNSFDAKGKLVQKKITIRDNYEVRMPSGDSVVGTVEDFKKLGIEFPIATKGATVNAQNTSITTDTPKVV